MQASGCCLVWGFRHSGLGFSGAWKHGRVNFPRDCAKNDSARSRPENWAAEASYMRSYCYCYDIVVSIVATVTANVS